MSRAGCDVGAYSFANLEFESATAKLNGKTVLADVLNTYGATSSQVMESLNQQSADFQGVAVHCAQMRYNIRCNALLPGYIATDLNREFLVSEAGERLRQRVPTRRFGEARDLDGPLLLLCSDAGRHITGAALPVDGGHLTSSL